MSSLVVVITFARITSAEGGGDGSSAMEGGGGGASMVGWGREHINWSLLLPLLVRLLVLNRTSVWSACVSKILTDILFYVLDIPQSTRTIREPNLIKWCQ